MKSINQKKQNLIKSIENAIKYSDTVPEVIAGIIEVRAANSHNGTGLLSGGWNSNVLEDINYIFGSISYSNGELIAKHVCLGALSEAVQNVKIEKMMEDKSVSPEDMKMLMIMQKYNNVISNG